MKANAIFSLLLLILLSWSSVYAQAGLTIPSLNAHPRDTICADIDPWLRIPVSYSIANSTGIHNRWYWDFGDGTTFLGDARQNPMYHYYGVPGTYPLKVCVQAEGINYWISACDSLDIVVQQGCASGKAQGLRMKQDTACVGLAVQFGDSLTGEFSHLSYRWDFGDGASSAEGWGVSHTYAQTGSYAASLCVIDRNLNDTFCIQEIIHVKNCSPISALRIVGPDTVCKGTVKHYFEPQVTGGSGNFAYSWQVIGIGTSFYPPRDSNKISQNIYFQQPVPISMRLRVTDLSFGNSAQITDTLVVRSFLFCPFSAEISRYDTVAYYQSGFNPYFQAAITGSPNPQNLIYQWSSSRQHSGQGVSFSPTIFSPGNMDVYLTVIDPLLADTVRDTVSILAVGGLGPHRSRLERYMEVTLNDADLCAGKELFIENTIGLTSTTGYYSACLYDMGDGQVFLHPAQAMRFQRDTHTYVAPGIYTVKYCLYNPNHNDTLCRERQVYVAPSCELEVEVETTEDYGGNEGTAHMRIRRGGGFVVFDWDSTGAYTFAYEVDSLAAGTYHLYARNLQGLTDTVTYVIPYSSSVFPGDCNHDQIADINDLLPIGLHHGNWGPLRPNASLNWTAQPAPLWGTTQANGRDIRHVDTNGDGIINDADTLAIQLNYNMTHNNLRSANAGPKLFYQMPAGPHNSGDTLRIPVHLATMDTPVVNLYGLTFGITYDTALVEAGSARFDFSNSWLGTKGSNMLTMYHADTSSGRMEVGFVRKDQMNVSGFGRICDIIVVVDDHIGKRQIPFRMGFYTPYAIDNQADEIEIGYINGETALSTAIGSGHQMLSGISLGQTEEAIHIFHPNEKQGQICLFDMQGRLMRKMEMNSEGETKLMTSSFSPGVYVLRVRNAFGVWQRKVILLNK